MADSLDATYYTPYHSYAVLGGKRWHYLDIPGSPNGTIGKGKTLMLFHGFPDCWYGWRRQIPVLRDLGYRLIVPSLMGYTRSEAPLFPTPEPNEKGEYPELGLEDEAAGVDLKDLECYTGKFIATCMNELLDKLEIATVVIIGHDYGAYLGPKLYLYFPERVEAIATSCWHYTPAQKKFMPIPELVKRAPSLAYQSYLLGEAHVDTSERESTDEFLRNIFADSASDNDDALHMSEQEFKVYMEEYGIGGRFMPYVFSTYKARRLTFDIEKRDFLDKGRTSESMQVDVPYLHIGAKQDMAFQPSMMKPLRSYIKPGRLQEEWVDGSHWLLFEKGDEVNSTLSSWLRGVHGPKL